MYRDLYTSFNMSHQHGCCTYTSGCEWHTALVLHVGVQHAQLQSQLTLSICYEGKREPGDGLVIIVGQDVLNKTSVDAMN